MKEWMNKTQEFIDRVFSLSNNRSVKCPCNKCRNVVCENKRTLTLHLCKVGFMSGYEVWIHHGESAHQTASVAKE
jgi:cytidine deaminase